MQLILNEPKAFLGTMAKYGKFRNANNYILGLNTCRVGFSYSKVPGTYELGEDILNFRLEGKTFVCLWLAVADMI